MAFTMGVYEQFIHKSRYARYLDDKQRRETWPETINRYLDFVEKILRGQNNYKLPKDLKAKLFDSIHRADVMPSMRAMMTAGDALARDNTAGFTAVTFLSTTLSLSMKPCLFCCAGLG